ncbi:DegT/DnrJ/EryC1/StrS family aminotransferase [Flavobacterium kingsejongi]|uniref:Pyridoxal phosphate-dependent aminotransferase n=1 Tax=Flavobacterium kingsejongi TaxID=1678728 RepID=A0A2S1LNP0_9FLAO|nr:DegT/DnrJ/EryC1/StrS family aminotransferase [Flavobacterium kingsejongi]AWG25375.1 pyridoxal phosphate-dependent aminotransferase [Flavobacterium kingsejongi]
MKKDRIFLSLGLKSGSELKYIQSALSENWITLGGPHVDALEKKIECFLDNKKYISALNSGTSAIHLGLILLGVQKEDEVLCQTMTFSASANPIVYLGATPVFIDSEPDTWNICPVALEKAILDRIRKNKIPKAIIAVDLYGMPYKADEVRNIANKYSIPILEDSAEALGSIYKGRQCGTLGDIGVFSFNGNKIITTSGGGALITSSDEVKKKAIFLATQARDDSPYYQHSEIGYNYRMSNIAAGIGCAQMEVLEQRIMLRKRMHEFYVDYFKNIDGIKILSETSDDYKSNHWLNAILIDPETIGGNNTKLRVELEHANIESRFLWKPMHLQPVFRKFPYYGGDIAEQLFDRGLCLPSGANINKNHKLRIKKVFDNFFKL